MLLYYLTPAKYAKINLTRQWLKVSRFEDLNDPFEVFGIDRSQRPHRAELRKFRQETNQARGLICFTRDWQNPVMWGHYGDRHRGMALGFKIRHPSLAAVIYARTPLALDIDPDTSGPILNLATKQMLLRTKFREWKYERERRMIVRLNRCSEEKGLYFWPFAEGLELRRVVIGPHCTEDIAMIRAMVRRFEPAVEVIKARLAFKSFRVVRNKKASEVT